MDQGREAAGCLRGAGARHGARHDGEPAQFSVDRRCRGAGEAHPPMATAVGGRIMTVPNPRESAAMLARQLGRELIAATDRLIGDALVAFPAVMMVELPAFGSSWRRRPAPVVRARVGKIDREDLTT